MKVNISKLLFVVLFFLGSCADDSGNFEEAPPEEARRENGQFPVDDIPGAPPWPSKTCDRSDLSIFENSPSFSDSWSSCARKYQGNSSSTTACLRNIYRQPGLTIPCGNCFGAFAACGKDKCYWTCARTLGKGVSCESMPGCWWRLPFSAMA